jgi:hypothetical protein
VNGVTGCETGPLNRGTDHGARPANGRASRVIESSNGRTNHGTGRVNGAGAGT